MPFKRHALVGIAIIAVVSTFALAAEPTTRPVPSSASELFQETTVWTVHLKFTAEQWAAIEPKRPNVPFGGPGVFGPAAQLAPAMLRQGDRDKDGTLSKDEFAALAESWFTAWDKDKVAKLTADQLRTGLNAAIPAPTPRSFLQGTEGKRNGLASAMGIDFEYVHADLEFEGQTFLNVAVRYKGNGTFVESWGSPKRSLKVDLNRFVKGQKLAGVTQLNFHNNITDASWMNEVLSFRLYRDAGIPSPRTAYARLYITVPGTHDRKYFGLYSLVEDVGKAFAEERFGKQCGPIFKPVTPHLFTDLGDDWAHYIQTYDPKDKVSPRDQQRLMERCRFNTKADEAEFAAKLGDFIDLEQFARYMAVTVFLSDLDGILGPGQNFHLYLDPKTRKFIFMPWDQDHSFGQFSMVGTPQQRENLSIHRPWRGDNAFLAKVYRVEAFKKLYLAKLEEFSKTIFKPERFHQQVDEIAGAIRPAVQEESASKLGALNRIAAGKPIGTGGLADFFQQPTKPIKPFVTVRLQSILDQLAGKSQGQTLGPMGIEGPPPPSRTGPDAFGPGNFLAPAFMKAMDDDRDGQLTRDEYTQGFTRWFSTWNTDHSGKLTDAQLRAGINKDLALPPPGPPAFRSFGPPPGPPPRQP